MAAACSIALAPAAHAAEGDGHLSIYAAQSATDRLAEILRTTSADLQDSYLLSVAYGRSFREGRSVRWEWEGQLVRHTGMQRHGELNAVLIIRWMRFPWDSYIDTRVAFGEGLSHATREPAIEPRAQRPDEDSTRTLNYLLLEVEAKRPLSQWSGFLRIHHRSGIAGLFDGVHGGSNFVGLGVRLYR